MMSTLEQLQQTFRLADAIDIAFVALFLYALFMWFKSTASRPIVVGVGILAVVYVLARALDMYMTSVVFQAGLAFAAVAVIVVFQEDLRRAFTRIAALGTITRRRGSVAGSIDLDVLIESIFALSAKKVGALVVIRGTEPLDRHCRGGVAIDARLSRPLLDSIFDPHSMGHDGAVILELDRIQQFAVHLPLSDNHRQIGARGTRHAAGLGLSEVSDALVIIVSEERGEVSVAENGKLESAATAIDLKRRSERFMRRLQPPKAKGLRRQLLVENPGWKVASVALACLFWFFVSFEAETVNKTFVVPIEYRNLPDALDIDDTAPTEARVTLSGFERAFGLLAPSALKVSLDLSTIGEGRQQIVIDDSHVKTPSNLSLFRTSPRIVSFEIHKWLNTKISVQPRTEGRLPTHLQLREVLVTPNSVTVSVWSAWKSTTNTVYTEVIDLSRITETSEQKVKLVLPQHVRLAADQPTEVQVKIVVASEKANTTNTPSNTP